MSTKTNEELAKEIAAGYGKGGDVKDQQQELNDRNKANQAEKGKWRKFLENVL